MSPTLSELKITPRFCFPLKIPDDPTATNKYCSRILFLNFSLRFFQKLLPISKLNSKIICWRHFIIPLHSLLSNSFLPFIFSLRWLKIRKFFFISGKDIRPTYAGSKSSAERLKRGIVYARILVRDCLMETERSARNWFQYKMGPL